MPMASLWSDTPLQACAPPDPSAPGAPRSCSGTGSPILCDRSSNGRSTGSVKARPVVKGAMPPGPRDAREVLRSPIPKATMVRAPIGVLRGKGHVARRDSPHTRSGLRGLISRAHPLRRNSSDAPGSHACPIYPLVRNRVRRASDRRAPDHPMPNNPENGPFPM